MASIEKRIRNGKTRYYVRFRTPEGQQRTKTFDRKKDAADYLTSIEGTKLTGTFVDPARSRLTLSTWADQWLAGRVDLAPKTRERYEGIVSKHIAPRWGRVALAEIRHADIQAWLATLELAPASVRKVHRVLSMILGAAVRDGRLGRNPAELMALPRVQAAERRFLTHRQVEQLADAVGEEWRLVVRFLAYTGVRWGEMAALRVHRLDLLRRRALIAESVTPVRGVMTWGPTKGHERREVPIPAFLARDLEELIGGRSRDDLVFVGPRGAALRSQTFQRAALTDAAEHLGLCSPKLDDAGRPVTTLDDEGNTVQVWADHFHPHELRHTAASLAIASGADVKVVQQMLGHKSATMTLDLYGHLFGDRLDVVADAMDAARAASLAERVPDVYPGHLTAVS